MNTHIKAILAATLIVGAPSLAAAQDCPSYAESGAALSYSSEDLWVEKTQSVTAGGNLDLALCATLPGVGHVIESPDFTLQYNAMDLGRGLLISVDGQCDTVLLVNTATAQWLFDDDSNASNPALLIEDAPSGQYDIWVGTYGTDTCSATLNLETF